MSAKSDRIIAVIDTCDPQETGLIAAAALGFLPPAPLVRLILETLGDDGMAELIAHFEDGEALS